MLYVFFFSQLKKKKLKGTPERMGKWITDKVLMKKILKIPNVGDSEQLKFSYSVAGTVNQYKLFENCLTVYINAEHMSNL